MSGPPVPWADFDYHIREHLEPMYKWAGSMPALERAARVNGITARANTMNLWREKLGIPIADPGYRARSKRIQRDEPETRDDPQIRELAEYFQNRTVPDAPGPTASRTGQYATALLVSDPHAPFHHEGALEVVLGLVDTIKPEEFVLVGDAFDFAQIGHYIKDPNAHATLQSDIDYCREKILARIGAACPGMVKRFIVGNHEEGRWNSYLFSRAPDLASLRCLTMEAVLGLTEMGWVWQPYEYWPTDTLCIYHGDRHTSALGGGSAMSARKESIDMGVSTCTGHTHHAGAFFRQDRAGYRVSYELGCLCDWRKMQAAHVTTRRTPTKTEDWHLCCALVRYRPGHSAFKVDLLPIIDDGKRTFCIYQGEEIAA